MGTEKEHKETLLELIRRSDRRPAVRNRSAVFEDKTKYKRSREKQKLHNDLKER